jgi:exportin-5
VSALYSADPLQLAIETLYSLYSSVNFVDEDINDLVGPMFHRDTLHVLKQLYEWTVCPADDIDDEQYLLCKKFSEVGPTTPSLVPCSPFQTMHNIGKFYRERPHALNQDADIPGFLNLLLQILQNESLHVSIPILHYWALLLNSSTARSEAVIDLIGPLLEICSRRLIRYELLPDDSNYPAILFLKEDVDTMPERHAFLGNYARFGRDIVEQIVGLRPYDALSHILTQAEPILKDPYQDDGPFNASTFKKASLPALKVDARCTVIEAALSGYVRWRSKQLKAAKEDDPSVAQADMINSSLEKWGLHLLDLWFEDAAIQQRISGLAVDFAIGPLKTNIEFVVRVFKYVLQTKIRISQIPRDEKLALYNDALKDLQKFCSQQLQRIALRAADYLIASYSEISESVHRYTQSPTVEDEDKDRCFAVLFVITQRATTIDDSERDKRLNSFVEPCLVKWQDSRFIESLQDFSGFCKMLGLSGFEEYFMRREAHKIEDWTEIPLDEDGRNLKAQVDAARHELPLRMTKTFLSASLDRSEPGTRHYAAAERLWSQQVTVVLPSLLHLIGLSHLFSDPSSWVHGSPDLQEVLRRILKDRFWQVGISSGSRDEFYTKVEQTKQTLEGLASSIRGSLRFVRETSDRLVATLSLLGDGFYSLDDLPVPLSRALFERSVALSTHQTGMLIETVKPIIDNCPVDRRSIFLTPLLTDMFKSLDKKVRTEWVRIDQYNRAASEKDDLVEEMKDESILRQLTFNCVTVVARLFDPNDRTFPSLSPLNFHRH